MCGIFGYVGNEQCVGTKQLAGTKQASSIVRQGLKNLDYRGYDSWGVVTASGGKLDVVKNVGLIPNKLPRQLKGVISLGHTRWATHGGVTKENAHPHLASDGSFALAHNGIVENMAELKQDLLKKKYKFLSETDSEVIVGLIESQLIKSQKKDLSIVLRRVVGKLNGRNTVAVLTKNGVIYAVKQGSPLVVGRSSGGVKQLSDGMKRPSDKVGRNSEQTYFLSSDTLSFAGKVNEYAVIEDGQMVKIDQGSIQSIAVESGKEMVLDWKVLKLENQQADLKEKHYMIQEIKQTPEVIKALVDQPELKYKKLTKIVAQAKRVITIGSGTAGLAAAQIAYYLRVFSQIEATSLVGAESASYYQFFDEKTVVIAPSQSGETADVLEVLELAKERGSKIITQVNMPGSGMTRISDLAFMAEAGPEKCVMSTKIFSSQIAWGYLLAKTLIGEGVNARQNLSHTAVKIDQYLSNDANHQKVKQLAKTLKKQQDIFLLATGDLLTVSLEGMIKLIEGTYKHAHAIAAGDLKHYAITLMEEGVSVIVLTGSRGNFADSQAGNQQDSQVSSQIANAATEVKTRGAEVIAIGPKSVEAADFHLEVPDLGELQALASILPLQLLSYYLTDMLGLPVDKPRNIAKSVTVK